MLAVWVVGGMFSFFGAVAFAELGAAMPEAGGIYIYLREAYGPLISFLFGWTLFLVIDSGSIATLAVAFSHNILPRFVEMTPLVKKFIAAAFVAFLGAVNYVGLRWGSRLQNLTTYLKTSAIGIIVVGVFFFAKGQGRPVNFVEPAPGPFNFGLLGAFGVGLVASLWAYKGWEAATYSAGEVKNPRKNLPLGILIGTVSVIVLYVLANLAYLYIFPVGKIAASEGRVALDAMQIISGPFGDPTFCTRSRASSCGCRRKASTVFILALAIAASSSGSDDANSTASTIRSFSRRSEIVNSAMPGGNPNCASVSAAASSRASASPAVSSKTSCSMFSLDETSLRRGGTIFFFPSFSDTVTHTFLLIPTQPTRSQASPSLRRRM
jgi:amino acid transporter